MSYAATASCPPLEAGAEVARRPSKRVGKSMMLRNGKDRGQGEGGEDYYGVNGGSCPLDQEFEGMNLDG